MVCFLLLILFALTAFDAGPAGAGLRRWLVETPARMLSRLGRRQALGLGLVVLAGIGAFALFEAEGLRMFSMAAPEMTAWAMMFDVSVVFDMAVLAIGLKAVAGWRGVERAVGATTSLIVRTIGGGRSRARRVRRPRPPQSSPDDQEPGWATGAVLGLSRHPGKRPFSMA